MPERAVEFVPSFKSELTYDTAAPNVEPLFSKDPNPKTLTGRRKLPVLSVIPPASLIHEADAMRYGAYEAPRVDGTKGYDPYNWRDSPIEAMIYIDAALRHMLAWVDGEDLAPDSKAHHLGHAKATLGILLDAMENATLIDNRPRVRELAASRMLAERTQVEKEPK
jgi:hypothetical protein